MKKALLALLIAVPAVAQSTSGAGFPSVACSANYLNQTYADTTNNLSYKCANVSGVGYTWQMNGSPIFPVTADPTGNTCTNGFPLLHRISTGVVYSCQSRVYGAINGGSSGSGTVNSGTTGQIAYYAGNGTAVSGTSTPTSTFLDQGGQVFNVKAYGAKLDARFSDPATGGAGCATTASSAVVTCSDLAFVAGDVGKVFTVRTAGTSGAVWKTTVASVQSGTQATMNAAAPSSVTAGTSGSRAAIGTDDTSAWQSALAAAAAKSGIVFFPAGFSMIAGPITLTSGITIAGTSPRTLYNNATAADFELYPTAGSWFDCEGASLCFNGNYLNQITLSNFGMTDAISGASFGANAQGGLSFSSVVNVGFSGNYGASATNASRIAVELFNSQHVWLDHPWSAFVDTGLHLITQGSGAGCCATTANNTIKDFYTYSNAHSTANGNLTTAPLWLENKDSGAQMDPVAEFVGLTQVNDFASDGNNYHVIISSMTTGGSKIADGHIYGLDMEGPALCGVNVVNASAIWYAFSGQPNSTTSICFDSNSAYNTVQNAASISDAGLDNVSIGGVHNLGNIPKHGLWFTNANSAVLSADYINLPQYPALGTGANSTELDLVGWGSNGSANVPIGAYFQSTVGNGTNPFYGLTIAPKTGGTSNNSYLSLDGWTGGVHLNGPLYNSNSYWNFLSNLTFYSALGLYWSSGSDASSGLDTAIFRKGVKTLSIGAASAGDTTGQLDVQTIQAGGYYSSSGGSAVPTCNSTNVGMQVWVSDGKASPTYRGAYAAADGSAKEPVYCIYNGTSYAWEY